MTPDEWLDIAALWARIWPHRPLPPESIEPWYDLLADLDGADVRAALMGWAADPGKSWPPQSPGELRARIDVGADWTDGLARLVDAIRRHGRWLGRPDLSDPALDAFVDSFGGWTAVCTRFDAADPTTRAQFRDAYRVVVNRHAREKIAGLVAGTLPALEEGDTDG